MTTSNIVQIVIAATGTEFWSGEDELVFKSYLPTGHDNIDNPDCLLFLEGLVPYIGVTELTDKTIIRSDNHTTWVDDSAAVSPITSIDASDIQL